MTPTTHLDTGPDTLTGRVAATPAEVVRREVLEPQFAFEAAHYLRFYVLLEKVLLLEYTRLGLLDDEQASRIGRVLHGLSESGVRGLAHESMSDISFAVERAVSRDGSGPPPSWHVDRSRNDLQATAQLLYGREAVARGAESLVRTIATLHERVPDLVELPMPGYTHLQAAQVISPGFHLMALGDQLLRSLNRLAQVYDDMDASPLGAGAMSGQELAWDRERMAALTGCARPQPHALCSVASRRWVLEVGAELSCLGTVLSRFVTDLMAWGGQAYGFVDLPDELSGISASMPQKKNFPVLERIRGRTAHLAAFHVDFVLGQRNTHFANSVEVGKEAGTHLPDLFEALRSATGLLETVLSRIEFRADPMRRACERDHLGGFSLANRLTLSHGVPWRTAQVVVGAYVVEAGRRGLDPVAPDAEVLRSVAAEKGYDVALSADELRESFDADRNLRLRSSSGSAHPDAVRALLHDQAAELTVRSSEWEGRRVRRTRGPREVDRLLGLETAPAAGSVR